VSYRLAGLLVVALIATQLACTRDKWTSSLPVVEREERPQEMPAYPEDGKAVGVNPPGFTWTPNEKAAAYRLEVREGSSVTVSQGPLTSTVCPLSKTLKPGSYSWQVVYLDAAGAPAGVSKTRTFTVSAGLPELPMPDVARLKAQLAGVRPRLFLSGNRIQELREAVRKGRVAQWSVFLERTDRALAEKPYAEPAGYKGGKFNVDDWRRIFTPGKQGSAHVARAALAYRLTGEEKYLEGARRWMMNLANWDPKGIMSHDVAQSDGSEGNDEASMPMLERMSYAWDWMGDKLTPEEKRRVLEVMTERGNQVLRLLHKQDFLSHPFSNHEGRVLAFLGNAGLAFLGDIPDAEKWLDYVLRCYLTSYPGWGGDEGGWAQGTSYWAAYMYWLTTFAEALRDVTDVDIFRKPFYRNTGYFAVYFHPPYAPRGGFGDGAYNPPGEAQRMLVENLANAFKDPVLKWQVESVKTAEDVLDPKQWREWMIEDVITILRTPAKPDGVTPKPPADMDGSRVFGDIGWAAMHSALGDPREDVWALFKSSRFGSFSHSHADQNTFQLNAYGRALLIDSGYYPWYGSPHDELWTRQTRAHNGVLVNGRGQPPFEWAANGTIERYERKGALTIVRGQAAKAYNIPQTDGVLKLWAERLKEPVPPMEPKVETFERTLVFVSSKTRPVLFIQDYVRTDGPATVDWLLHALNQMQTDQAAGVIRVRDGDARAVVRVISSERLRFSQTDRFNIEATFGEDPGTAGTEAERKKRYPNQWHLNARTEKPASEIRFLAVVVPSRASEKEPPIESLESAGARGFRVAGSEVTASWGAGEVRLVVKAPDGSTLTSP